jgi:thymidylate synthase ThyX
MPRTSPQFSFVSDLNIASLSSSSDWHEMKVNTLLQNCSTKQPSVNAYLGARYSRSADSIVDIAKEVTEKGTDSSARLEAIFHGYGHRSVGDMADLFLCIENIPMFTALKLFYLPAVHSGQERSTRYQDFSKPKYVKLPKDLKVSKSLRDNYDSIISLALQNYQEMLEITKARFEKHFEVDVSDKGQLSSLAARSFDTARYFLPLGLTTSMALLMSARTWSEMISLLRGSTQRVDQELSELLFTLLSGSEDMKEQGYIPEADSLIRHTDPNSSRGETIKKLMNLVKELDTGKKSHFKQDISAKYNKDDMVSILRHLQLLKYPLSSYDEKALRELVKKYSKKIGETLFATHNHNNLIGNVAQTGSIALEGMTDIGVLKDLKRHRSLEKMIPILFDEFNLSEEFDRPSKECFRLCDYLQISEMSDLKKEFEARLVDTYDKIKDWYISAEKEMGEVLATEFTRYLLPHAHLTSYRFYGSLDDLQYTINLRTRNGGHIAYRNHTYEWLESLEKLNPVWDALKSKIVKPDFSDRNQFIDRG